MIEDGVAKLSAIRMTIEDHIVDVAASVNSGKAILRKKHYDLIIIDMNLPTFDMDSGETGRIQYDGGIILLHYAKIYRPAAKCILFTQYDGLEVDDKMISLDDITLQLRVKYPQNFLGSVHYDSESDKWMSEMQTMLGSIK